MMTTPVKSAPPALTPYEQGISEAFPSPVGLQEASWNRFQALGMPTRRLEAWKYIDLKPVLNTAFRPYEAAETQPLPQGQIQPHLIQEDGTEYPRLVFINGALSSNLSNTQGLPPEVTVRTLTPERLAEGFSDLSKTLEQETDAFAALNGALFQQGALVSVPDGVQVPTPVQLLFITTGSPEGPRAAYLRNLITVGKEAGVSLIVQFVGLHPDRKSLNNVVNHLHVDVSGRLDVTMLQAEGEEGFHFAATHAQLQEKSLVDITCVAVGGHTSRHHVDAQLLGEEADCRLNGLSVLSGAAQVYRHVTVEHQVPNSTSRQLFKSIVDDQTRAEFDGTIVVYPNASGTDAEQLNKNLLLSDDARVYTRPQLRIDNDDVKCAHGATVGQLEDEELFYLFSRGIGKDQARSILTYGFAEEILEKHTQPALHAYLNTLVLSHLNA